VLKRNEFWSRVFTFVPTATKDDGEEIDEKAFRTAIDYQIENGVHGVCIFGSTGGNGSFSDEEMKKATAIAAKHIGGRISLVAGTGARTTTACIALSKHAQDVGCDAVMVLPVSYWPLTPDEVFEHYERVSKIDQDSDLRLQQSMDNWRRHEAGVSGAADQTRQLHLYQGEHGRPHAHHCDPAADWRSGHIDCGMGDEQLAGLHGWSVRVGARMHELRSKPRHEVLWRGRR